MPEIDVETHGRSSIHTAGLQRLQNGEHAVHDRLPKMGVTSEFSIHVQWVPIPGPRAEALDVFDGKPHRHTAGSW
jgi:hypothetical protein